MNEERLSQRIWEWRQVIIRKGTRRNLRMQEVTNGMTEKGINSMEWIDKDDGEKK